jgi:prophage maintenance system killer protein
VRLADVNGLDLSPPETEVVTAMLALASGNATEEELAAWVRRHAAPM